MNKSTKTSSLRILISFGTRPELIKLAPLIRALKASDDFSVHVHCTGQHASLLKAPMMWFDIVVDSHTEPHQYEQSIQASFGSIFDSSHRILQTHQPDIVLVHGDTTSALAMSLAAFYAQLPVVHLEAGLRTKDLQNPWPEEMHRQVLTVLSSFHLAPTSNAQEHLLQEGVPSTSIAVVGNTVIDALMWSLNQLNQCTHSDLLKLGVPPWLFELPKSQSIAIVTAHRRENFNEIDSITTAIKTLAKKHPNIQWVWPVHPNPLVSTRVYQQLDDVQNIRLIEPLAYPAFVYLMQRATLIVTDSGGIQEEATILGIPVAILRNVTERVELLNDGQGIITKLDAQSIVHIIDKLIYRQLVFEPSAHYGTGHAAQLCVDALCKWFVIHD